MKIFNFKVLLISAVFCLASCSGAAPETQPKEPPFIVDVQGADLDQENKKVWIWVEPGTAALPMSDIVSVSEGAEWKLYCGETEIPTKVAAPETGSLIDGDNVFSLVVSAYKGSLESVYELTVYRSFIATVSYEMNNVVIGSEQALTGRAFELPTSYDIEGYTFDHWTYKRETVTSIVPWGDVYIVAVASANSYVLTLNANGGEIADSSMTVRYGQSYFISTPTRSGFGFEGWFDE